MATADDYAAWIVKNQDKRGTPDFDTVAKAYQEAKAEERMAEQRVAAPPAPPPAPGLVQRAIGAGETGLALTTGATGGLLGMLLDGGKELTRQILSGEFGNAQSNQMIRAAAGEGARALTFEPRTQAGREMTQAAAQGLQQLPPFIPAVGPLGAVQSGLRQAAPAAELGMQRAGAVAGQVGQVVTAPVRKLAEMTGLAEPKPYVPGELRYAQQFIQPKQAPGQPLGAGLGESALGVQPELAATTRAGSVGAAATPETLRRVTTAEGLPVGVTLTRGAATRDAQQLAFEKEQIKGALGGPLRDRAEENNLQALQNFDALIDMTNAQLMDLTATGNAVIKALSGGLEAAKNRTRAAYTAAEKAGELENNVTLNSVIGYINENIPEGDLAPVLRAARQKAIAVGAATTDEAGNLVAQPITLAQAENLRKTFQRAGFDGADQFHGSALRRVFDVETEGLGGDLYKKARQTRLDQARKFENRAIVARLIQNRKGMEDPKVAADQVFARSILGSSPEEITFLKRVLLTTGDEGQQAWKELQGATVRHLRDRATKNMGMDSFDRPLVSPAKLHDAIVALDSNNRLDLMLGKKNAQIVRDLDDVVRYVMTVPPGTLVNTSGTAGTLMAAITEAGAQGLLTGFPVPVLTGTRQISKMLKEGRTKKQINDALNALPVAKP